MAFETEIGRGNGNLGVRDHNLIPDGLQSLGVLASERAVHTRTRAALRTETTRAGVFLSHWDFARDCPSRCIHPNASAHTSPAYGTCRAKRTAYLAADEMFTRHKQQFDRVCVANLTDHRVTLRGSWLSLPRHARSFPGLLLRRSGLFARGLRIASAHVLLEIAEESAGVGLLTCPDRIPSSRTDLPHPFRAAHKCRI